MTLPRKNSRKVTINRSEVPTLAEGLEGLDGDALKFRWLASAPHFTIKYGSDMVSFHAHLDKEPSDSILEVIFHVNHCDSITPLIAKAMVLNAINDGWDPQKKGVFRVSPEKAVGYFEQPGA